jgi:drug/metabolite transporter (DMT)-like permease
LIEEITATPPRTAEGKTAFERDDAAKGLFAASSRDRDFAASRRRQLTADAALLLVTLIWGSTFVMVKDAVANFPVFSFLALRFAFAALVLLPFVVLRQRNARASVLGSEAAFPPLRPSAPLPLVRRASAPLLIGTALFAGYSFQTAGLHLTTPAKAGFITGLSVVIVPLFAALILRQPPTRNAWLGVGFAVVGLGLLTLQAGLGVEFGDLLVLCCAVAFAAHILLTGRYAPHRDPLRLTLGSLITVAVLSSVAALIFDRPLDPAALTPSVLFAAAFTGVFATSVAFGLQTQAQRFTTSTHTALLFAAEPVFAGLFSFLLIGEVLGAQQVLGAALILVGMVVAEMKRGA